MKPTRLSTILMLVITLLFSSNSWLNAGNAPAQPLQVTTPAPSNPFRDDSVHPATCRHCHSSPCCCEPVCCPRRVTEKEEKSCWKVACEFVCVPGFRFPWEKCSGPVCGWVRCVNVLEEHTYECDTCGYEWEVKCVCTNQGSSRHRCKCPRCQRECR